MAGEGASLASRLVDFLEEGLCPLLCGFFYINELTTLRLVCRSFRNCVDGNSAGVLREMSGLVFPAEWPAGDSVRGFRRQGSMREKQCSSSSSTSSTTTERSRTRGLSLTAVTSLFRSSYYSTPESTGKPACASPAALSRKGIDAPSSPSASSGASGGFNLFSCLVSLCPPPPHLVEVSLHLDEEVHLAEFLLPVFSKLLEVCDAVEALTLQIRLSSWVTPLKMTPISKVFPRVKRLRIRHSFISRAVRTEKGGDAIYSSPAARRPRLHLLSNSLFPACEEVEVHEVPVGDSDPASDRIDFVRRQELRTVAHVLTCLTPNVCRAAFTLSHVRDLPPLLRVLAEASNGARPFEPNFPSTDCGPGDAGKPASTSGKTGLPCQSLKDLTVFQTLPEEDQGGVTDDEGRQGGPSLVGQEPDLNGEDGPGVFAPSRVLSNTVFFRSLETIRLMVKDDDTHDTFESSLLPMIRRICPSVRVKYEGASSLPLAVAGRALSCALPHGRRVHASSSAGARGRHTGVEHRRSSRRGQRGHGRRRNTPDGLNSTGIVDDESQQNRRTFDLEGDGVSQGMVEMIREWIAEPEWMEVGLWNPIVERPPRLEFLKSSWHGEVVAHCSEFLRKPSSAEPVGDHAQLALLSGCSWRNNDADAAPPHVEKRTVEEHTEMITRKDLQSGSLSTTEKRLDEEGDPETSLATALADAKRRENGMVEGTGDSGEEEQNETGESFVLPTVTVNHTLFAFDSAAFVTVVRSLPQFVLALDPYNTSPQSSELRGPFPNLLGVQVSICRWSKIFLSAECIGLARRFASQVRLLRLLDSNRLEYKSVDASAKAAVDAYIDKILDACPRTCVVEYRRVSAEYTWQMETGSSDDTPPFSVEQLCRKGFRFLKRIDVPFAYDDLLPGVSHCAVTVALFARSRGRGSTGQK